jgi:hypothetical protein
VKSLKKPKTENLKIFEDVENVGIMEEFVFGFSFRPELMFLNRRVAGNAYESVSKNVSD